MQIEKMIDQKKKSIIAFLDVLNNTEARKNQFRKSMELAEIEKELAALKRRIQVL